MPIDVAIDHVADIGYQGIELLADVPHAWPAGLLRTAVHCRGHGERVAPAHLGLARRAKPVGR